MELIPIERIEFLKKYQYAEGFSRYVSLFKDEVSKNLVEFLEKQILEGKFVLLATKDNLVVGFAVVSDWKGLPETKVLDIIEVAKPFREKGIGTMIMNWFCSRWDALEIIFAQSEPGQEKRLVDFYNRFGFKAISDESFTPVIMARIPPSKEKLMGWIAHIEKAYNEYSYELFNIKRSMPIWGRRYAPWLNYNFDIYGLILKEMHRILNEIHD